MPPRIVLSQEPAPTLLTNTEHKTVADPAEAASFPISPKAGPTILSLGLTTRRLGRHDNRRRCHWNCDEAVKCNVVCAKPIHR